MDHRVEPHEFKKVRIGMKKLLSLNCGLDVKISARPKWFCAEKNKEDFSMFSMKFTLFLTCVYPIVGSLFSSYFFYLLLFPPSQLTNQYFFQLVVDPLLLLPVTVLNRHS